MGPDFGDFNLSLANVPKTCCHLLNTGVCACVWFLFLSTSTHNLSVFSLPQEITTLLPFSGISLDILPDSSDLGADLSDYIHHRVSSSTQVATNVTTPTGSAPDQLLLSKFSSHLSTRSHGSILYLQLTLDLFHKGHLALKGGNYLVVPVSLSEVCSLCLFKGFPLADAMAIG